MRVLGAIIAGGKSSRMGQDKALMVWRGKALIERVIERLEPQVDELVINANRPLPPMPSGEGRVGLVQRKHDLTPNTLNHPHPALPREERRRGPIRVIPDLLNIGTPLAGLHAVLTYALENSFDAVLSAPCDAPLLPEDLRLRLQGDGAAIACSGGQAHFLTGLWPAATLPLLIGLRRVQDFAAATKARRVEWAVQGHDPFTNLNTPEDLARLSENP